MAENLNLNVNVDTSGATSSVGSLKKQLREAQQEVTALAEKFGATSIQAINAAKKAAELKDAIGDAKALTEAFNPDAKFKALTASLSGVAGGFGAVQGAMALFGVESEDVQKTLLKVQSAMAISQGLQSVGESIDSFKQLGAVIKSTTIFQKANEMANKAAAFSLKALGISAEVTSTSFKVMKTAIISTGIGVLIIALGEAVAAFQSFQSSAEKAAEAQRELNASVLKFADAGLKAEQDFLSNQEKINLSKAKLAGKSEKEIFEIEQNARAARIRSLQRHYEEVGAANSDARQKDKEEIDKINADGIAAQNDFQLKQKKQSEDAGKKASEISKQNNEKAKQLQKEKDDAELDAQDKIIKLKTEIEIAGIADEYQAKKAAIDAQLLQEINLVNANEKLKSSTKTALIIELGNAANAEITKITKEQTDEQAKKEKEDLLKKQEDERGIRQIDLQSKMELIDKEILKKDDDFNADIERYNQKRDLLIEQQALELENLDLTEFQRTEIRKKYSDARVKINEDEAAALKKSDDAVTKNKIDNANAIVGILGSLNAIAGENEAISKGLALTQIGIDTAQAISALVKNSEQNPLNSWTFGGAGLTQFLSGMVRITANIANAKRLLSSKSASVSAVTSSVPSLASAAPMTPQIPQAQTTNISQQSINQMGNQAVRAYVIETDVTSNQQRVEAIKQRARFS